DARRGAVTAHQAVWRTGGAQGGGTGLAGTGRGGGRAYGERRGGAEGRYPRRCVSAACPRPRGARGGAGRAGPDARCESGIPRPQGRDPPARAAPARAGGRAAQSVVAPATVRVVSGRATPARRRGPGARTVVRRVARGQERPYREEAKAAPGRPAVAAA